MAKDTKNAVVINDVEYQFEDLTPEQQMLVNHVADLDRKLASSRFAVDQLQVGRNAFMTMLTESLSKKDDLVESA
ncbi:MAG TPA: hypothetical protein VLA24_11940 [Pseudomonadales bacterium]|nr:hypothetical protein [Pseudomonadales bacterium]